MDSQDCAIRVSNLSKVYKVYDNPLDLLLEAVTRRPRGREHWALRDVSFEVGRGEVVGVIGRNGAGKTTLLRIVANTLDKTSGTVEVNGRISALMALGTGFNMDLSGRENILMGGLCLGMTHQEIKTKEEEIIEFSGVRSFIDSPCRTYSSGMLARLAFSVAAHVDPDVLIVDEALATGDAIFLAKSYARMRQIAASGATVLLVSHSMQQIYDMCDRAIYLEGGEVAISGAPKDVGAAYEMKLYEEINAEQNHIAPVVTDINQCEEIEETQQPFSVLRVRICDQQERDVTLLRGGEEYSLTFDVRFNQDVKKGTIHFFIKTITGVELYGVNNCAKGMFLSGEKGEKKHISYKFKCTLAAGSFYVSFGTGIVMGHIKDYMNVVIDSITQCAYSFSVEQPSVFTGYVDLNFNLLEDK